MGHEACFGGLFYCCCRETTLDSIDFNSWSFTDTAPVADSWYNCQVRALAFSPESKEFILDVDYIFQWIDPTPTNEFYSFLMAPCTIVFQNAFDLQFEIGSYVGGLTLDTLCKTEVTDRRRVNKNYEGAIWQRELECVEGSIAFLASGYTAYAREATAIVSNMKHGKSREYSFSRGRALE